MRRHCARPGCSAVATTTFTFDSDEKIVFLDAPNEGGARAGELCARHVRALAPPRGWQVVDRRDGNCPVPTPAPAAPSANTALAPAAPAPVPEPAVAAVAQTARVSAEIAPGTTVYVAAPPPPTPWHPRFERGDSLGGVLEADTPLLSRAFRNVRAV
jgi:uncharacterized protein DUF3499